MDVYKYILYIIHIFCILYIDCIQLDYIYIYYNIYTVYIYIYILYCVIYMYIYIYIACMKFNITQQYFNNSLIKIIKASLPCQLYVVSPLNRT